MLTMCCLHAAACDLLCVRRRYLSLLRIYLVYLMYLSYVTYVYSISRRSGRVPVFVCRRCRWRYQAIVETSVSRECKRDLL